MDGQKKKRGEKFSLFIIRYKIEKVNKNTRVWSLCEDIKLECLSFPCEFPSCLNVHNSSSLALHGIETSTRQTVDPLSRGLPFFSLVIDLSKLSPARARRVLARPQTLVDRAWAQISLSRKKISWPKPGLKYIFSYCRLYNAQAASLDLARLEKLGTTYSMGQL
jgi:hypothetical protein